MLQTVIYQNDSKTVAVLDLPFSLTEAQRSAPAIRSVAAPTVPYASTEPRGREREKLLDDIPQDEKDYHNGICELLKCALLEARSLIRDRDWCYYRRVQNPVNKPPQLAIERDEQFPRAAQAPPWFLSSTGLNCVPSLADLRCSLVINRVPTSTMISAEDQIFTIPCQTIFLCTTIADGLPLLNQALASSIFSSECGPASGYFDFILLDPPWANRSVRHSGVYRTAETQNNPFDQVLPVLQSHLKPNGVVAIWITNKAALRASVLSTLADIGFMLFEEWIWLKVTIKGEPVTEIDGIWRKPYEILLLFRRIPSPASMPQRRVMIAVPDLHSRKPCLKRLLEPLLPEPYRALEVFARGLTVDWWSWGDECLLYQHTSQF